MKLAENIRELRMQFNISQAALSEKTGLSQSAIARWELGKSEPTAEALCVLAEFFEVSVDDLLGRDTAFTALPQRTYMQELYAQLNIGEQERAIGYMESMLERRGIIVKRHRA